MWLKIKGKAVTVIREDLCCPFPGPNNAKMRGVIPKLLALKEQGIKVIATQNTRISRLGWGVSWIARKLGIQHYDFYPKASEDNIPFYQQMSEAHGGSIIGLRGNRQNIFRMEAKQWLKEHEVKVDLLPIGLTTPESLKEIADVVALLDEDVFDGTLVIPSSSGATAAGIIYGLAQRKIKPKIYVVFSSFFKNRFHKILDLMTKAEQKYQLLEFGALFKVPWKVVPLKRPYGQPDTFDSPFPCDLYLDRPIWHWLVSNIKIFKEPITFWNIGGEWNPIHGIRDGLRGDGIVTDKEVREFLDRHS